jgi:hypothetical protein
VHFQQPAAATCDVTNKLRTAPQWWALLLLAPDIGPVLATPSLLIPHFVGNHVGFVHVKCKSESE